MRIKPLIWQECGEVYGAYNEGFLFTIIPENGKFRLTIRYESVPTTTFYDTLDGAKEAALKSYEAIIMGMFFEVPE